MLKNPYSKLNKNKLENATSLDENDGTEIQKYLKDNPSHFVLNCGSGNTTLLDKRIIHLDIFQYKIIDVISDAGEMPFRENSFNAIFCHAVLEHVKNPFLVAEEFSRLLKSSGYISISIPFLHPYHDVPDHYFNATTSGIKTLFENFESVSTGVLLGPWYAFQNIIGNYKKMLKRVYKDKDSSWVERIRVFCIYRLLSWGMKFNHKTIQLTEEEQNLLAGAVYFKGIKKH